MPAQGPDFKELFEQLRREGASRGSAASASSQSSASWAASTWMRTAMSEASSGLFPERLQ